MEGKLTTLIKDLALQIPSFLTVFGCMILAVVRWKHHPRVSLVVLIALLLMAAQFIIAVIVYTWVPDWIIGSQTYGNEAFSRNVYLVIGLLSNGFFAVALAVLLAGIFMRRDLTNA